MSRTILVIEDDYSVAQTLQDILESEGYTVVLAPGGQAGLHLLSQQKFDLVLSDLMMPGMGGREVYQKIRENPTYHDLPVLLMSAGQHHSKIAHANSPPFIAKPFNINELLDTITGLFSSNETT